MSGGEKTRSGNGPAAQPVKQHRPRFPVRQVEHPKPRKPPVVPMLILAVVALVPLGAALRALRAGAMADAIGPMIGVGFIAFIGWRMLRGRRS